MPTRDGETFTQIRDARGDGTTRVHAVGPNAVVVNIFKNQKHSATGIKVDQSALLPPLPDYADDTELDEEWQDKLASIRGSVVIPCVIQVSASPIPMDAKIGSVTLINELINQLIN